MYAMYRIRRIIGESNIWQIGSWRYFNWRKAVAVSKHNSYKPEVALFKFARLTIIPQTIKLNTPPIILRIRYVFCNSYADTSP